MKPTIDQQLNLLKLAKGLASLPEDYKHFGMSCYVDNSNPYAESLPYFMDKASYNKCGTAACAAGHGPYFGIKGKKGEDWDEYIWRVFGIGGIVANYQNMAWSFLFDPDWSDDPVQAAKRITMFLENDCEVPNEWDFSDVY